MVLLHSLSNITLNYNTYYMNMLNLSIHEGLGPKPAC